MTTTAAFLTTTDAILRRVAGVQRDKVADAALRAGTQAEGRTRWFFRSLFAHVSPRIGCLRLCLRSSNRSFVLSFPLIVLTTARYRRVSLRDSSIRAGKARRWGPNACNCSFSCVLCLEFVEYITWLGTLMGSATGRDFLFLPGNNRKSEKNRISSSNRGTGLNQEALLAIGIDQPLKLLVALAPCSSAGDLLWLIRQRNLGAMVSFTATYLYPQPMLVPDNVALPPPLTSLCLRSVLS